MGRIENVEHTQAVQPARLGPNKEETSMTKMSSRILCIDDDAGTCEWVRIVLKGSQIRSEITCVKTGRAAIELLSENKFDLCILEYALPDMTGVQFCSFIRHSGNDVPVMFFTAMDRPIDKEKATAAGADEYLCKPDDLDIFVPAVQTLLKRRRAIYHDLRANTMLRRAA